MTRKATGLLALWAAAAALGAPAARAAFTPEQMKLLVEDPDSAEARAQYFYHYFKRDRDQHLQPPPWVDQMLGAMMKRPVWQDPEEGVLNEAQLWQAPVSVLYEFFEHTKKTFPQSAKGSNVPPAALIKEYEDNRVRFQMALDRLYRARLGDSLGGRGRTIIAYFDLILKEMDSVLDALTSSNGQLYNESVMAIGSLTRQAYDILHKGPRGYEAPQPAKRESPITALENPMIWKLGGLVLIFIAMWSYGALNAQRISDKMDARMEESKRWAMEFNRQFVKIRVQYLILGPIAAGVLLGVLSLNIFGLFLFSFAGLYLGLKMPGWVLNVVRYRRGKRVEAQLMDAMILMSNALKSGLDIVQGFELVQRDLVPPISEEFGLVIKNYQLGTPFEKALLGMEERIASRLLSYMIKSITLQRSVGGNLTKIFDRIVENIREEGKLEQKAQALTAQQRIQSLVVGVVPWLLVCLMWVFQPDVMSAYYFSTIGVMTILFCVVWMTIGMGIVRKLADIQV